jgi:hypothetical protein
MHTEQSIFKDAVLPHSGDNIITASDSEGVFKDVTKPQKTSSENVFTEKQTESAEAPKRKRRKQ